MARRRPRTRTLQKADRATAATAAGGTVFTPQQVAAIAQAIAGQGSPTATVQALPRQPGLMSIPFGPGVPLTPAAINPARPDSGRPEPRAYEYAVTSNLPGINDKLVPWNVLRQAADGVSIFRKCIEIRKNEFSSLEWDVVVSKKAITRALQTSGGTPRADLELQMQNKLAPDIARITDFWMEPDRRNGHSWIEWIKKALEERFVLDALAIYPRHTYGGELYSFEILDGSTIKPLLDADGGRPMPPSAAYQQILWGFPRGEFVADLGADGLPEGVYPADQLIYEVDNVRAWTPYGYSATERALTDGALYVQRNAWQLATYTDGVMPSGWLLAGEGQADWNSDQLQEYERLLNDYYAGITAARQRLRILPWGMTPHESTNESEKYKPDYDLYLLKLCAGHYETTIAELGFTEPGGLGSTGYHEGQADVQDRKATKPTVAAVQFLLNKLSRRHLGMPAELEIRFAGHEPEDLAAEDEIGSAQYANGRKTLNDERDRLGLARYPFEEANKPFIVTGTGLVFIEGALERQQAQQDQAQQIAEAKSKPPTAGGEPDSGGDTGHGPDDKPTGPPDGGDSLNKVDDADLIKTELTAYARWARRNPNPRRPFTVQYAQPSDFTSPDPTRLEFDEWVWEPDTLAKFDTSLHPRDHRGRFRKRTLSELASFLEGKHGKDRSKWPPRSRRSMEQAERDHHASLSTGTPAVAADTPPAKPVELTASQRRAAQRAEREAARQRALPAAPEPDLGGEVVDLHPKPGTPAAGSIQLAEPAVGGDLPVETPIQRGRRHKAAAAAASEVEYAAHSEAGMDVVRERGQASPELAALLDAAGTPEEAVQVAREFARGQGLARVGGAGKSVLFDPRYHEALPGVTHRSGEPVMVAAPGYVTDQVVVRRALVVAPSEPAPALPTLDHLTDQFIQTDHVGAKMGSPSTRREARKYAARIQREFRAKYGEDDTAWPSDARQSVAEARAQVRYADLADRHDEEELLHDRQRNAAHRRLRPDSRPAPAAKDGRIKLSPAQESLLAHLGKTPADRLASAGTVRGDQRTLARLDELGLVEVRPGGNVANRADWQLTPAGRKRIGGVSPDTGHRAAAPVPAELTSAHALGQIAPSGHRSVGGDGIDATIEGGLEGITADEWRRRVQAMEAMSPTGTVSDALFPDDSGRSPLRKRPEFADITPESIAAEAAAARDSKGPRPTVRRRSRKEVHEGAYGPGVSESLFGKDGGVGRLERQTLPPSDAPGLTPAQREILQDLEGRRAEAEFERATAPRPEPRDTSVQLVHEQLKLFQSSEEAEAYLRNQNLSKAQLQEIVRKQGKKPGSAGKEQLIGLAVRGARMRGYQNAVDETMQQRTDVTTTALKRRRAEAARDLADIQAEIDYDDESGGALSGRERNRLEGRKDALHQEINEIDAQTLRKADDPDPKAPTPPDQRWPAWTVDTAIAAAYAAPILTAMAGGLTTLAAAQHLAERWLAASTAHPGVGAATWLEEQGFDVGPELTAVLDDLYTEAAYAGQRSAEAAIATPARLAVSLDVDWGQWTPGDVDAARMLYTGDRLQQLLDRFGIVIRGIAQHRLDELAQILAQGLADGDGPEELARKIGHLTGSKDQAYRIAVTETARALSAAAIDEYDQSGIASKGWMAANDQRVCQLCQDNEDAGDIPLDAPFPSGEPFPPAHPHCRCAIIPGLDLEGA